MKNGFFLSIFVALLVRSAAGFANAESEAEDLLRHELYAKMLLMPFEKSKVTTLHRAWPKEEQEKLRGLIEADPYNTVLNYYGFRRASFDNAGYPLGLTPVGGNKAYVNCMMCHTGHLNGKFIMGLGDTRANFALFAKDYVKRTSLLPEFLIHRTSMRYVYVDEPTDGVNYAGGFAVLGLTLRDEEERSDVTKFFEPPLSGFQHLASDTPAWWNVKYKNVTTMTGIAKHSPKG